jgi:hypothetical protein
MPTKKNHFPVNSTKTRSIQINYMKRTILLTIAGCLLAAGWAMAQKQELLHHIMDAHLQQMDDNSCSSSSSSDPAQ